MKIKAILGFAVLALTSVNCVALSLNMKPGLWEHSFKLDADSLSVAEKEQQLQMQRAAEEMKKNFANMPPEQRKAMEAMMSPEGMKAVTTALASSEKLQLTKDGTVTKECVTQAKIDKGQLKSPKENCKNTIVQTSSNIFKITEQCTGKSQSRSEVEVNFQNPKSYSGKVSYSMYNSNQMLHADLSGKWLSSDCGNIEPESDEDYEEDYEAEDGGVAEPQE